ncbi:Gfo/Idh/MocA family oxidoreductase [Streptomyces kunmingensis]|uniref:Gfo/Idh/MocA family oxidoreductase n=1 Tax=Streptomyces kunmingensis TaxID=68225 RepID=A0ABU6CAF3_9ACTN|nr:Gfo/Idh/MocA family oxidoreductase [Streptomyces kunmingensis]MEB3961689.1 Gfo/Idh/MocA family oxidoreductase [Streptomyces kunmingensis]
MPDIEPLGVAVLGAADIARRRTVPALLRSPLVRLVAVASRTTDKARTFADRFGCEAVTGYERLLDRDDVDAVYIPLPNALHETWAEKALRAGKHVMVEKSLTASAAAATELARTAQERNLAFMENFAFLHHTQHTRVRELLADGAIGTLRVFTASFGIPRTDSSLIRYSRALAGGALRETGCYPIRAAQLFLGEDVEVVGARLRHEPDGGCDLAGSVLLADGAGTTAQCDFGLDHAYRNTYALWGSEGRIEVDWAFTPPPGHAPLVRLRRAGHTEEWTLPAADQFLGAVTAFAEAARDPAAHREHSAAAIRQAALVESVVELAGTPEAAPRSSHVVA